MGQFKSDYNNYVNQVKAFMAGAKKDLSVVKEVLAIIFGYFFNRKMVMAGRFNGGVWIKLFDLYLFCGSLSNDIYFPGIYLGKRDGGLNASVAITARHGVRAGYLINKKDMSVEGVIAQYRAMGSDSRYVSFKTRKDITSIYIKDKHGIRVKQVVSIPRRLKQFVVRKRIAVYQEQFSVLATKEAYKTLDEKPAIIHLPYIILYEEKTEETRYFNVFSFVKRKPMACKWEAAPGSCTNNLYRLSTEEWLVLSENNFSDTLIDAINKLTKALNPPG